MNKIAIIAGAIVLFIAVVMSAFFLRHLGVSLAIKIGVVIGLVVAVPIAMVVDNLTDEYAGDL